MNTVKLTMKEYNELREEIKFLKDFRRAGMQQAIITAELHLELRDLRKKLKERT